MARIADFLVVFVAVGRFALVCCWFWRRRRRHGRHGRRRPLTMTPRCDAMRPATFVAFAQKHSNLRLLFLALTLVLVVVVVLTGCVCALVFCYLKLGNLCIIKEKISTVALAHLIDALAAAVVDIFALIGAARFAELVIVAIVNGRVVVVATLLVTEQRAQQCAQLVVAERRRLAVILLQAENRNASALVFTLDLLTSISSRASAANGARMRSKSGRNAATLMIFACIALRVRTNEQCDANRSRQKLQNVK